MENKRHQLRVNKDNVLSILEMAQAVHIEPRDIVIFPGRGQWIIEFSCPLTRWNVLARKMLEKDLHKVTNVCL